MELSVLSACVHLRHLPQDNAGAGFLGFLDFMGDSLNPHRHSRGRFSSWWTHFLVTLTLSDGETWKVERTERGVDFALLEGPIHHAIGVVPTIVWNGRIPLHKVKAFVTEQQKLSYDFSRKNCQHFAYDFFRYCLCDHRAHGRFEDFTELCQAVARERGL